MKRKLYDLALWYIRKCNSKWKNDDYLQAELDKLDRLTYQVGDEVYLSYGLDKEWQNFNRYLVIQNAIRKLAIYEDAERAVKPKYDIKRVIEGLYGIAESEKMIPNESARFTLKKTVDCLKQAEIDIRADERTKVITLMNKLWKTTSGREKAEKCWFDLKEQLKE